MELQGIRMPRIWLSIGLFTLASVISIVWITVAFHRLGKPVPGLLKVLFFVDVLALIYSIVQGAIATIG